MSKFVPLEISAEDLERLGIMENQQVVVRSETGAMENIWVRSFPKIKPGNVLMYYPEANVLVPRAVDPLSKTPSFKNVAVWLEVMHGVPKPTAPAPPFLADGSNTATSSSTMANMRAC